MLYYGYGWKVISIWQTKDWRLERMRSHSFFRISQILRFDNVTNSLITETRVSRKCNIRECKENKWSEFVPTKKQNNSVKKSLRS